MFPLLGATSNEHQEPLSTIQTDNTQETKQQQQPAWQDPPMIPVRGMRATRTIEQGEIVISIPFQALLTVGTTIDQDPVLSRVMGPEARKAYGWILAQDQPPQQAQEEDNPQDSPNSNPNSTGAPAIDFFELPLLAMALLHHSKLGTSSPLYPYIHLLRKSPVDSMPFLWNKQQRKQHYYGILDDKADHPLQRMPRDNSNRNKGIQSVARSIRLEMKDMYQQVIGTLVQKHPDLFGKPDPNSKTKQQQYDEDDDDDEWAFSFENFQWAFAMVNSRHWLLPIQDLEGPAASPAASPSKSTPSSPAEAAGPMLMQPQGSVDGVPPAEMPTDAWLLDHELNADDDEAREGEEQQQRRQQEQNPPQNNAASSLYHSFLAPVADFLNFGPPCTRGRYNQTTHTFDIIASCNFTAGQEVTFWYSDECEDIVIGNYGFSHPMVPKCPTADDLKDARDKWKEKALALEEALEDAYEDMDVMDTELQHVQRIVANCDCCDTTTERNNNNHDHGGGEEGFHGNYYLRTENSNSAAASQKIRGGGTMMSSSSSVGSVLTEIRNAVGGGGGESRSGNRSSRAREDRESRSARSGNARGGRSPDEDDDVVERHGVRRMWAGRSGL